MQRRYIHGKCGLFAINDAPTREQHLHPFWRLLPPVSSVGLLFFLGLLLWLLRYRVTKTSSLVGLSQGFYQAKESRRTDWCFCLGTWFQATLPHLLSSIGSGTILLKPALVTRSNIEKLAIFLSNNGGL